jgi:acyl-CoA synthetase (AMP-forming)/AMP-acid ligase II
MSAPARLNPVLDIVERWATEEAEAVALVSIDAQGQSARSQTVYELAMLSRQMLGHVATARHWHGAGAWGSALDHRRYRLGESGVGKPLRPMARTGYYCAELPKTISGKIRRSELRRRLDDGLSGA